MRGSQGLGQLGTQGATLFQTNRAVGILDSVISWGTLIYIYTSLWPRRLSIWHSWEGECGRDAEELGTGRRAVVVVAHRMDRQSYGLKRFNLFLVN